MRNFKTKWIIGIDEVGRGPIAGPVAIGFIKIAQENEKQVLHRFVTIKDSKQLSEKKREVWFGKIIQEQTLGNLEFCVTMSSSKVIDKKGIVPAISTAMKKGLKKMKGPANEKVFSLLLDGSLYAPKIFCNQETILKGDETEIIISMASVVAKVTRDRKMKRLSKKYPGYGFERHKGYGTKFHYGCIEKKGMSEIHRRSFLRRVLTN